MRSTISVRYDRAVAKNTSLSYVGNKEIDVSQGQNKFCGAGHVHTVWLHPT